jgi:hypothetical protein
VEVGADHSPMSNARVIMCMELHSSIFLHGMVLTYSVNFIFTFICNDCYCLTFLNILILRTPSFMDIYPSLIKN